MTLPLAIVSKAPDVTVLVTGEIWRDDISPPDVALTMCYYGNTRVTDDDGSLGMKNGVFINFDICIRCRGSGCVYVCVMG